MAFYQIWKVFVASIVKDRRTLLNCSIRLCMIWTEFRSRRLLSIKADNRSFDICITLQISQKPTLNRPFYRYGGHVELIGFKEYYGIPQGLWAWSDILASVFPRSFRAKFSTKKIVMGKKDSCAAFGVIMTAFFDEKYTLKFSFYPKSARKYWASAPLCIP